MNIIDELQWRDAINQQTNEEGLRELVENNSISLYCGLILLEVVCILAI